MITCAARAPRSRSAVPRMSRSLHGAAGAAAARALGLGSPNPKPGSLLLPSFLPP